MSSETSCGIDVNSLTSLLSKTSVEEETNNGETPETELSFAGRGLKLNKAEDAKEIVEAIEKFPKMETLRLEGNTVGREAAEEIGKALNKHPEFKKALWSDMFTGRSNAEIPPSLKVLSSGIMTAGAQLVELNLSDNAFGAIGVEGIKDLLSSKCCYSLRELRLNNNGLGITGGKLLAKTLLACHKSSSAAGTPLQLNTFISGRNRLENDGAKALAEAFKAIGTLQRVEMPQNGIQYPGVSALADALAANTQMRILNLNDNTFTEVGSKAIAKALPQLKNLEEINFGDCLMRDEGAEAFAKSLKSNTSLKRVVLTGNEISVIGANAILTSMDNKKNLEFIDLNENQIGEEGIELIRGIMDAMNKLDALGSLSDDEGDDDEEDDEEDDDDYDYNDDEEEEVEEEEEEEDDEEEEEHISLTQPKNVNGDGGTVDSPVKECKTPSKKISASEFLTFPSPSKLLGLGGSNTAAEGIKDELGDKVSDVDEVVKTFLKISSVVDSKNEKTQKIAKTCTDTIFSELLQSKDEPTECLLSNSLLVHMGLIKCEDKHYKPPGDLTGALIVLEHCVQQAYFHGLAKEILSTFISKPSSNWDKCIEARHAFLQTVNKF